MKEHAEKFQSLFQINGKSTYTFALRLNGQPLMRQVLALLYLMVPPTVLSGLIWCHIPDPAMEACKGHVSAVAVRRCVFICVPPPTERLKPIPVITRAFKKCERRINKEGAEAILPYLNATLAVIEAQYGRASVAYADALGQIISLLSAGNRIELVPPYAETYILITKEVFGRNHRETAVALQTRADTFLLMSKDGYAEEAIPLLRKAVVIRRRVLGTDHEETFSTEAKLAELILMRWQRANDHDAQMNLLDEAQALAENAASALRQTPAQWYKWSETKALLGRIAYARGDFEKAVVHFRKAFDVQDSAEHIGCYWREEACADYAAALRKLGRNKEASDVQKNLNEARKLQRRRRS